MSEYPNDTCYMLNDGGGHHASSEEQNAEFDVNSD